MPLSHKSSRHLRMLTSTETHALMKPNTFWSRSRISITATESRIIEMGEMAVRKAVTHSVGEEWEGGGGHS